VSRAEVNRQRRQLQKLAGRLSGTLVSLRGSPKAAPVNQLRDRLVKARVWGRVFSRLEPGEREVVRWSLGPVRPNLANAATAIVAAMGGAK
jgi:hypothetical protein